MHTAVYEKSPKFRACWFAGRFANVLLMSLIWLCSCNDWVSKLSKYWLQQFPHNLTCI